MIPNRPIIALVVAVGFASVGCNSPPPKQPGDENNFAQPESTAPADTSSKIDPTEMQPPPAPEKAGLNEDQRKQMEIALHRGGDKAAQCPSSTGIEDAPRGKGEVTVTFDGQKGRITEVVVGPPWAGTPIESCIKRSFVGEIVLPFEGDALEVPYTVELPKKKEDPAAAGSKKKK